MFSKSIVMSDKFLDLPCRARDLYFFLSMGADDDGFVGGPKSVMRMIGASQADLDNLRDFVYVFKSGVVLIRHWMINNLIRKDRYKETQYKDELQKVFLDDKGVYQMTEVPDQQPKIIEKVEKPAVQRFVPPTIEEVRAYCEQRRNGIDAEAFVAFYKSKGWKVGKDSMKDWKSSVITWEKRRGVSQVISSEGSSLDALKDFKV